MESSVPPISLDRLLAHREWVRRMARSLVRDENEADDLEQDMWLETLERPPRSGRSLRGWFASALRHDVVDRRRSGAFRARREESQARRETVRSAADLVAEADAHKRIVVAVMGLAEPYRATVLYRFFDDIPPSVIAARTGVPVETVRTRLRRALTLLRERFDAESRGGRAEWSLALLPLLEHPGHAFVPAGTTVGAVTGGVAMKTSAMVGFVAASLAACGLAWWAFASDDPAPVPVAQAPAPSPGRPPTRPARARNAEPSSPAPAVAPAPAPAAPVAAAAMAQAVPPAPPVPAKPPTPIGEVAGRVLLVADRSPVDGATVTLRDSSPAKAGAGPAQIPSLTTGATGEFRFRGVPVGTYALTASKEGFTDRTMTGLTLTDASGVEGLEVLLSSGGGIAGVITDAQGAPVSGISVTTQWGGPPPGSAATKSGDDGSFAFANLPPGSHHVIAEWSKDKLRSAFVSVVDGETARVDFGAAAALLGVVLDENGAAVPGAIVRASTMLGGKYTSRQAKTDESGHFRVDGLDRGEWNVGVQVLGAGAFAADNLAKVTVADSDQDVTLRLASGSLAGRVCLKATGAPVVGRDVQLSLYSLVGGGGAWKLGTGAAMAFADKDGAFRFRGLAPGRYRLFAYPHTEDKTLRVFEKDFDVAGAAVEGVEVALEKGRTGTVRIVAKDPDGKPVEGATVLVTNPDGTTRNVQSAVEAPGIYVVVLEAGRTELTVFRADLHAAAATVDVVEGQVANADVVLAWGAGDAKSRAGSGEIGGRVSARGTRKALTKNDVQLSVYTVTPWKFLAIASAGDDGQFRFRGLAPGSYRVFAFPVRPVFRKGQIDVTVPASGNAEGVELVLDACTCGKAKFVVKDAAGKPLDDAKFLTTTEDSCSDLVVESPSAGVYVGELETGARKVEVRKDGFETAAVDVVVKAGATVELKVVLRPKR
jgi:RNA polymerase sigma factor (sigma-70 family)